MFARAVYTVAAAAGLVLGAIAVVAGPAAAVGWVAAGVFVGAIANRLRGRGTRDGAVAGTSGPGRPTGLRAGAATCAGGLVLTGLGSLLGPASGIVILTLLLPRARPGARSCANASACSTNSNAETRMGSPAGSTPAPVPVATQAAT